jgi:hypothetical protein
MGGPPSVRSVNSTANKQENVGRTLFFQKDPWIMDNIWTYVAPFYPLCNKYQMYARV